MTAAGYFLLQLQKLNHINQSERSDREDAKLKINTKFKIINKNNKKTLFFAQLLQS